MRHLPTSELPAPDVTVEPCPEFAASEPEPGICGACGWLEDEHSALEVPAAA